MAKAAVSVAEKVFWVVKDDGSPFSEIETIVSSSEAGDLLAKASVASVETIASDTDTAFVDNLGC